MAEQVSRDYEDLDPEDYERWDHEVVNNPEFYEMYNKLAEKRKGIDKVIDDLMENAPCVPSFKSILNKYQTDMVNNPPHYTQHPSGIECIQVTEHMSFNVGNAVKYLWRCDHKGNALEDLKKARFYVQREIERREIAERNAELAGGGDETPEPL